MLRLGRFQQRQATKMPLILPLPLKEIWCSTECAKKRLVLLYLRCYILTLDFRPRVFLSIGELLEELIKFLNRLKKATSVDFFEKHLPVVL
jgi:hypothetical protein